MANDLNIRVVVDANGARSVLSSLDGQAGSVRDTVKSAVKGLGEFATGLNQGIELFKKAIGYGQEFVDLALTQIAAEEDLANALAVTGQYTRKTQQSMLDFANTIQDMTTIGDEAALRLLRIATALGVNKSKLQDTIKQAIGLSEAYKDVGLSHEQAIKLLARASSGNFEGFNEIIPEMRSLNTEIEKSALLTEKAGLGFDMATAKAKTTAGQIIKLKGVYDDLREDVGDIIVLAGSPVLRDARELIQWLADSSSNGGGAITTFFRQVVAMISLVAKEIASVVSYGVSQVKFAIELLTPVVTALNSPFNTLKEVIRGTFGKDTRKAYSETFDDFKKKNREALDLAKKAWEDYENDVFLTPQRTKEPVVNPRKPIEVTAEIVVKSSKITQDDFKTEDIKQGIRGLNESELLKIPFQLELVPENKDGKTFSDLMKLSKEVRDEIKEIFDSLHSALKESFATLFDGVFEGSGEKMIEGLKGIFKKTFNVLIDALQNKIMLAQMSAILDSFLHTANPFLAIAGGFAKMLPITAMFELVKAGVNSFETGGLIDGAKQLIQVNENGQEFVMNANATRTLGSNFLSKLNNSPSSFLTGGINIPTPRSYNYGSNSFDDGVHSIEDLLSNLKIIVEDNSEIKSLFDFEEFERKSRYRTGVIL